MRKKVFILVLSVILGLIMIPFLVHAQFYKWIDDKGDIRFTDEYSNIPEKYLPVAETQWFPKESSLPSIEEKPTPALAPKSSEPLVQETPRLFSGVINKVDYGARTIVVTGEVKDMAFLVSEGTRIETDFGKNVPFAELKTAMSVTIEYMENGDDIHPLSIRVSTMPGGFGKKQKEKQEERRKARKK